MSASAWPSLPYQAWRDTYATLHMWLQVAGKIAVAAGPPLNHCWGSAMQVTPRGLATRTLMHEGRAFAIAFDFIDHRARIDTADGDSRSLVLTARSVANFHREFMASMRDLGLPVRIWSMPVEIPSPVRFELDTMHASYDPDAVRRFWHILLEVDRVLTQARSRFVGKASPANFFWGSCDLALTRFSGRPAPPSEGPAFMREAYSHEVISHGFWPGNETMPEPVFYAYAVPQPDGFAEARVEPAAGYYHREMGEFLLPYEAVRTSASPADALTAFIDSTYDRAASLAQWDRRALER